MCVCVCARACVRVCVCVSDNMMSCTNPLSHTHTLAQSHTHTHTHTHMHTHMHTVGANCSGCLRGGAATVHLLAIECFPVFVPQKDKNCNIIRQHPCWAVCNCFFCASQELKHGSICLRSVGVPLHSCEYTHTLEYGAGTEFN